MSKYVLIVEDEALLYDGLAEALKSYSFEVSNYTKSYEIAIKSIQARKPDIVLLDIELEGDKNGFDLGEILDKTYNIPFIYITNSDDNRTFYQGLETNPAHYIVKTKPLLDIKQIIRTIDIVLRLQKKRQFIDKYQNPLIINDQSRCHFLKFRNIICCRSEGSYCYFYYHVSNNKVEKILASKNLKSYEMTLLEYGFLKIHRNCIINKTHIISLKKNTRKVVLTMGLEMEYARERKQKLFKHLSID